MHEVLNKTKPFSIDGNHPRNENNFITNSNHIVTFSWKRPKEIEKDVLTPAFEDGLYQKLNSLISGNDLILKKKSLKELLSLFRVSQKNIVRSLRVGIVETLLEQRIDKDNMIREYSYHLLSIICDSEFGRHHVLLQDDIFPKFVKLCEDDHKRVRNKAFQILRNLGGSEKGRILLNESCIPLLIQEIKEYDDVHVKISAIETFIRTLKIESSYQKAIDLGIFQVMKDLLQTSEKVELLSIACKCIGEMCFQNIGILEAVKHEMIFPLIECLEKFKDGRLKEHVGLSLMFITLDNEGKEQFISKERASELVAFLIKTEKNIIVKTNFLKVLVNVIEAPKGKEQFVSSVGDIRSQLKEENLDPLLKKSLQVALYKLTFKP